MTFIFRPRFVVFTGNLPAALMLSLLYQRFSETPSKLRVRREGKLWLAKDNAGWLEECGLTRQMLRTAEAKLITMGLLEKKVWKFSATPTGHYHLSLEAFPIWLIQPDGMVASNQSITIEPVLPEYSISTQLLSDDFVSQKETGEGMGSKTAREVLEGIQKKTSASPVKPYKVTAKSLSGYWHDLIPKHFDVKLQVPHSMKELGMLAQYAKRTGVHAVPAMEWAIANWAKYRYRAQEELGEVVSSTPRVGSLLKACIVAVEGYQKAMEALESPEVVQISAPEVLGEPDEPLATDAEIEAALKSVGKK